jgi:hypothetical protein
MHFLYISLCRLQRAAFYSQYGNRMPVFDRYVLHKYAQNPEPKAGLPERI